MSRGTPAEVDVVEAWAEVARLRRRALLASREAVERRQLTAACAGDPFHPRAQGLAAAADFHEARAAQADERARGAERVAAALEAQLDAGPGAARCV